MSCFKRRGIVVASALCLLGMNAYSQDDFFGAIDTKSESTSAQSAAQTTSLDIVGFISQKIKYGIAVPNESVSHERRQTGPAQLRTDLFSAVVGDLNENWKFKLSAKAELNYLRWEDDEALYELNEERVFLKDAFVDASFDNGHWLRFGHQIFAWGVSESLSISDVLSTTDQREFGQTELQDIREQVPAILYSLPFASGKLSAAVSYAAGTNRYANSEGAFYPFIQILNSGLNIVEQDAHNPFEYALRYERQFNGGDLTLQLADINDNDFVFNGQNQDQLFLSQERSPMASVIGTKVIDAWLLKAEFGYFANQAISDDLEHFHTEQLRGMLGAEYSGINNWRFSLELNGLANADEAQNEASRPKNPGFTLRINQVALNERLSQSFWVIALAEEEGQVYRWDLSFDWSDNWAFSASVVLYEAEQNSLLFPFNGNDTLNLSAKLNF